MLSGGTSLERNFSYREAFLASLSRSIALPTADWPTVRCWTKTSLDRIFQRVGESKPPQSNLELINWMEKLGLASAVQADAVVFYLLEIGASPQSEIDPTELLMAYEPFGVICYFSAIAFHSLTSQMPSHHHVAALTESSRMGGPKEASHDKTQARPRQETIAKKLDTDRMTRSKANPLGRLIFSFLDIPYYLTRRSNRLVPGVQNRSNGPRGRFRITTYEQTLLDTLYKPQNCGGPAVIFEAWQEALASGRVDEQRLVGYLAQMDYPSTTRRLGTMLQLMDYNPGNELGSYLDRAKRSINREASHLQISLLPGFDYSNLDEGWLVRLP
jgi:hypothetical protein